MHEVIYDWRPVKCGRCKQLGHPIYNCKLSPLQEWMPKPQELVKKEMQKKGESSSAQVRNVGNNSEKGNASQKESVVQEVVPTIVQKVVDKPAATTTKQVEKINNKKNPKEQKNMQNVSKSGQKGGNYGGKVTGKGGMLNRLIKTKQLLSPLM